MIDPSAPAGSSELDSAAAELGMGGALAPERDAEAYRKRMEIGRAHV